MSTTLEWLNAANRGELVDIWVKTFGSSPPPNTSQDMMRLIIGWELQAKAARPDVRALNIAVRKLLRANKAGMCQADSQGLPAEHIFKPKTVLSPGTRLSRDWQGRTYCVDVLDKGYAYDGKLFASLTPIAKCITGSYRSGPHFFGVST